MSSADAIAPVPEDPDHPLAVAFSVFLEKGDRSALVDYLLARSNLPGPRANLDLLHRFADCVASRCEGYFGKLWELCESFVRIPTDKAFAGSPIEFIPMCGTVGFGVLVARTARQAPSAFPDSMEMLKAIAGDPRWRVREALAIALQKILESSKGPAIRVLAGWIEPEKWLQMRAVAAALAEPPLLRDPKLCRRAIELHRSIVAQLTAFLESSHPPTLSAVMRSEPFRKLVQALEYSISVVVAGDPEGGFPFLRELAEIAVNGREQPESARAAALVRKILKGNLRKRRLAQGFPAEVGELAAMLG